MSDFRIHTIIGTALLVGLVAPAVSAEVPAQYRGQWCYPDRAAPPVGMRYYRCREATGEASPWIGRKHLYYFTEEGSCRVSTVTPTAKGHRLRLHCDEEALRRGQSEVINMRIDTRGHLHVQERQ
jgi:hypothetical protein